MQGQFAIVTDADMDRLSRLVRALRYSLFRDQQQLELLDQTLESAEVRPSDRVPKGVIRMNSRVRVFEFDTGQKEVYTLVFPEEANVSKGMISVLAPLGIALLGRRQGDVIAAKVPGGTRKLRVAQVQHGTEATKRKPAEDRPLGRARHSDRTQQRVLAA